MKKGPEFNLLPELPIGSRLLKPRDIHSYLCEPYVFESEEETRYYLKLASKISTNLNFDRIFKLVKTIFMKYVVLEDHYITLLAADVIYSYFQDKFGTTHYVICIGDNGAGKNSILMTFASLGYRVLLATSVSAANVFTFLGSIEECQGTIAEDEVDHMDDDRDKLNIYKSGYCRGASRIPKTDLKSGRIQDSFYTYCFKIFASESSLDNLKAKGLRDRSFEILCLVGKPQHNIKDVFDKCNERLKNELEKTRKLLFACRMLHHDDTIEDVNLKLINREAELTRMLHHDDTIEDVNLKLINREAELTKPLIRLFKHSPGVLKELLPALQKCLDAKRKLKSTSLEAILYTAITNLTTGKQTVDTLPIVEEPDGWVIGNSSIIGEVKGITYGQDILGQHDAFYCQDLGKVQHAKITGTLVDKFKAVRTSIGRDKEKERALRFSKEDFDRKSIEYKVPNKIEILPDNQDISSGPDTFDTILLDEDKMGTPGTVGTVPEGMDDGANKEVDSQTEGEVQHNERVIEPENSPTHPLEASPASPPSPDLSPQSEEVFQPSEGMPSINPSQTPMLNSGLDEEIHQKSSNLELGSKSTPVSEDIGSQALGPAAITETKPPGDQLIFPHNLEHDGHRLDGMLVLSCLFCNTFHTPIEIDMRVHLRDIHQKDLVIRLPLRGKGFDLTRRTQFAIDFMKRKTPQILYDHRTAKFAPSPYSKP